MKIRFYHWWLYNLFFKIWQPIFLQQPDLHRKFIADSIRPAVEQKEREKQRVQGRCGAFRVVK